MTLLEKTRSISTAPGSLQGKRVLVTGAAGFIGRHVARLCAQAGCTVVGMGHGTLSADDAKVWGVQHWAETDLHLRALQQHAEGVQIVFHCAGGASVAPSLLDPWRDFQRTVVATAQVLEFVRLHAEGCRLVYPSSAGVYGITTAIPTPESAPTAPVSPYGTHKLMAENLVTAHARQFGTSAAVVRLFSVYGAGLQKQLLWDATRKLAAGEASFMGTGDEVRDWLHVEDAADLLLMAAEHASTECPIWNGGSGEGITVRTILQYLAEQLGCDRQLQFTGKHRAGDPDRYIADVQKALAHGWVPTIQWQQGVASYAAWWRQEYRL